MKYFEIFYKYFKDSMKNSQVLFACRGSFRLDP